MMFTMQVNVCEKCQHTNTHTVQLDHPVNASKVLPRAKGWLGSTFGYMHIWIQHIPTWFHKVHPLRADVQEKGFSANWSHNAEWISRRNSGRISDSALMECKEGFLAKLIESRANILDKTKSNISAAQDKQKADYNRKHAKSNCLQSWFQGAGQRFSLAKEKEGKARLPLAWTLCYNEESWQWYVI